MDDFWNGWSELYKANSLIEDYSMRQPYHHYNHSYSTGRFAV